MKVHMKRNLAGYTGTSDEAIYYYNPKLKMTLMRPYVYPKLNHNNERITSVMANLKLINPSQGYRQNLTDYIYVYNQSREYGNKPLAAWNNAWLKIMYAMQKAMPGQVDLRTLTRQQIVDEDLPCKTLRDAIDFGLLPSLPDYERWNITI
jgi:hypothetical protein